MKKMRKYGWGMVMPVVWAACVLGSCKNEVDDVFDQDATSRIEAAHHGVRQYVAEFGVRLAFRFIRRPSSAMVNFVMRFKDGRVTMENAEGETSESTYKIANAEGPVLSFDTYSILHDLADPSEYPLGDRQGRRVRVRGVSGDGRYDLCAGTQIGK